MPNHSQRQRIGRLISLGRLIRMEKLVRRRPLVSLSFLGLTLRPRRPAAAGPADRWAALRRPGTHVMLRHAEAPGTGDPAGFVLQDCATQRNLDETGRQQAARIGGVLREAGLGGARVLSSQWCRCLDTARLLALGAVEAAPALNSFFDRRGAQAAQTSQVHALLRATRPGERLVLVTHQVNITALTGVFPAAGELLVLSLDAGGAIQVEARLRA